MNKALIINFAGHKHIFAGHELISDLLQKNFQPSLLIFEEFKSSAVILKGIEEIITIDRNYFQLLFSNRVYPKYLPLNIFIDKVREIEEKNFSIIINYSNCRPATYMAGHLYGKAQIWGAYYSSQNLIKYDHDWIRAYNEIVRKLPWPTYGPQEIYHKMLGTEDSQGNQGSRYIVRERHERVAKNGLNKLRNLNKYKKLAPKIIGIKIDSNKKSKSIPLETIVDLLKEMGQDKTLFPLLITGVEREERETAEMINRQFNHTLTIVEVDFFAAPSLLKNIDGLICSHEPFKFLANLVGTSVVEVSLGDAPVWGMGENLGDCTITVELAQRWFYRRNIDASFKQENSLIKAKDILKVLAYQLGKKKQEKVKLSPFVSAYYFEKKGGEIFGQKIDQKKEGKIGIERVMAKNVIGSIFSERNSINNNFSYILENISDKELNNWIKKEKDSIASATKDLLATIRLAIENEKDLKRAKEFVQRLDKLFSYCESGSLIKIVAIYLRSKIESIEKTDISYDLKTIIKYLYQMKKHIQNYYSLVEKLSSYQRSSRPRKISIGIGNVR